MILPEILLPNILFYLFGFILLASALLVILVKNPVHSILFLILGFFSSAGLFVLLSAEFIAMLMVIVYVGAVAVLFLFVVMMLNVNFEIIKKGFIKYLPIASLIALAIFAQIVLILNYALNKAEPLNLIKDVNIAGTNLSNVEALGTVLYTKYVFAFETSGLVLLLAMVGAITLTLRHREGVRKQKISNQVYRKVSDSVEIKKVETSKGIDF